MIGSITEVIETAEVRRPGCATTGRQTADFRAETAAARAAGADRRAYNRRNGTCRML
jgi:hypothetical protein